MWDAVLFINHQSPRKDYVPTKWSESDIRVIQGQNVGFRKEPSLEIAYQGANKDVPQVMGHDRFQYGLICGIKRKVAIVWRYHIQK